MEFLALDLRIQMAILLLILFSLVWLMAGKVIVRIASLLPWGLGRAFRLLYMLAEGLICLLHKKIGEVFMGWTMGWRRWGRGQTHACGSGMGNGGMRRRNIAVWASWHMVYCCGWSVLLIRSME